MVSNVFNIVIRKYFLNFKGKQMKLGKLFGVGIGPGDYKYLTLRAVEVLKDVDIIFTVISKNVSDSISQQVTEKIEPKGEICLLTFSMSRDNALREAQINENADKIMKELEQGKNCAFATLGDPCTYSTFTYVFKKIMEKYPELEVEIVPGITSFATLAAKAKTPLVENKQIFRVVPSFKSEDVEELDFPENSTTILLKTYRSRNTLIEKLKQKLDKKEIKQITYGEELAMDTEFISENADEIINRPEAYYSMIMVKK